MRALAGEADLRLQNASKILRVLNSLQTRDPKFADKHGNMNKVLAKFGLRQ
jgi:hypothetical protein